jgi:chemotaxis protein CheD
MMAHMAAEADDRRFTAPRERKLHIVQGEYQVSDDPNLVLSTLLGSCVAACIRDPAIGVGGMNHFLLPGGEGTSGLSTGDQSHGVHAMELLVNGLLKRGARRERLEAKLFGGGRLLDGLSDIGDRNSAFAEQFLKLEGIRLMGGSLRGDQARRIQYWPGSGRARQILLAKTDAVFAAERRSVAPRAVAADDDVELF